MVVRFHNVTSSHSGSSVNFHLNIICLHGKIAFINLNLYSFNLFICIPVIIVMYTDSQYVLDGVKTKFFYPQVLRNRFNHGFTL